MTTPSSHVILNYFPPVQEKLTDLHIWVRTGFSQINVLQQHIPRAKFP